MKHFILILILVFFIFSCSDENTTDPGDTIEVETFKSHNVKTEGSHYFTFERNTGSAGKPSEWDITFGTVPLTVETEPCQFFTMPNDPIILCGPEITIAAVDAATLDEVTNVPDAGMFKTDDRTGDAFIGKNWFDQSYEVKNDVHVIKTCKGNYALLQITDYDLDMSLFQITNIYWKLKYLDGGSMDFTSAALDSFKTENAYTEKRYYSFSAGTVTSTDSYDLKIDGSSLWLGHNCMVKKIEDTNIEDITVVTNSDFKTDLMPSYATGGWYSYGQNHLVTARDFVYVVNTKDGKYPAFEITSYYDEEGNSGSFTIKWKYLK